MSSRYCLVFLSLLSWTIAFAQSTQKPVLHGQEWIAITGKPLAATAGSILFSQGGNAVDAACAMLAATCTMWDVLSWGGETQALIYHPDLQKVIAINALGVATSGATVQHFKNQKLKYPPGYGPQAATTPGTPGGLMTMLAEYGTKSLAEVLAPAMRMAQGYPIEAQTANLIERNKKRIKEWPYSADIFLPNLGAEREAPEPGSIFVQENLYKTLKKLVDAETAALQDGQDRKSAIYAAQRRFYEGDIAEEFVRGSTEHGGLMTLEDLKNWKVIIEEPMSIDYKGIQVYKLAQWTQGPALLQALNMIKHLDVKSMGYNSTQYIHTLYQVMNLAFADRDFYYGDSYFEPEEPMKGLLSDAYALERIKEINPAKNDPDTKPGDPYPYQNQKNPFKDLLENYGRTDGSSDINLPDSDFQESFRSGTTTIQAADKDGWVVSITPSGGWVPAFVAGNTGIGMSQRLQSFVLDPAENPYNVLEPGKRPRVTLTPSLALKDGTPFLSFAVQGGDTQDQNLIQFFLNVVEFGMNVQQAAEAANFNSFQMHSSFGDHERKPGHVTLHDSTPTWNQIELKKMGYQLNFDERTSGPINAIYFDSKHKTFWGGSSNHGEDYGIAW